jgi:hypothetical protein
MSTAWHAGDTLLRAYRDARVDMGAAASVEAHLLRCPDCRTRLAALAPDPVLAPAFDRVVADIATPSRAPLLRLARRCGLGESDAALLGAARALDGSWALAAVAVLGLTALAAVAHQGSGRVLYLLLAPLLPVLGVVAAFAATDPFAEIAAATPYSKVRLAALRTVAVCVTVIPLVVAFGLLLPPIGWLAVGWLMPGLALTVLALALMTWITPNAAGAVVAGIWAVTLLAVTSAADVQAAVRAPAAAGYAVIACAGILLLTLRLRAARAPGDPR